MIPGLSPAHPTSGNGLTVRPQNNPANATAATGLTVRPQDDPAKVRDAAGQFEALLLQQILKSVREGDGNCWLNGEDQAGDSALAMAEEYLAGALAKNGGLGLAQLIAAGLQHDR